MLPPFFLLHRVAHVTDLLAHFTVLINKFVVLLN